MNHYQLYKDTCMECSSLITKRYSSSFSSGIRLFSEEMRAPIYAIYGMVRFADEIVDTFHDFDKKNLLNRFRHDVFQAIDEGISLNPVLQSFQATVNKYNIEKPLIEAFLDSMEMDLTEVEYTPAQYKTYIYGSAEVVGLMCLRVFCAGNAEQYDSLRASACKLGSAFQKINFLRDIRSDYDDRGRVYFPGVDFNSFTVEDKIRIEKDIKADFDAGLEGIKRLPNGARLGVYLAYKYYVQLFEKIKKAPAMQVAQKRIRVSGKRKAYLFFSSALRHQLNFL